MNKEEVWQNMIGLIKKMEKLKKRDGGVSGKQKINNNQNLE